MKRTIIFLTLLSVILLWGCSNDSNSRSNTIEGQWKLINVTGTFAGVDDDFAPGLITWDFNPIMHTVSIVNNNTDDSKWDVFETGVYNYQIIDNPDFPCGEMLKIDNMEMGCFSVTSNSLTIDQSIADGFTLQFVP